MRALLNTVVLIAALAAPASAQQSALSPDPRAYVSPSRTFTTTHISVDLDVDVVKQTVAGGVVNTVRALRDGTSDISFNCVDLVVESVEVDGQAAKYDYPVVSDQSTSWLAGTTQESADDRLVIHLAQTLARNATCLLYTSPSPR